MRILFIAHVTGEGGATIALLNLLKGLSVYRDLELAVVCPISSGFLPSQLEKLNVRIFYPRNCEYVTFNVYPDGGALWRNFKAMIGMGYRYLRGLYFINSVIKDYKPDIVHANSSVCNFAREYCIRSGIKYINHVREFVTLDFNKTPFPSTRIFHNRMKQDGCYNIAITNAVFEHFSLRDCDRRIYDGVFFENTEFADQIEFEFPYFLFVGNLIVAKGLDILIDEYLQFCNTNKNIHLLIVGKIKGNEQLVENCRNKIKNAKCSHLVHWLGVRHDIYSLMAGAKALVVPSLNEGFGYITAEAMFSKCLVIGRNTAGTKEQFDLGREQTGCEIGLRFDKNEEIRHLLKRVIEEDFTDMRKNAYNVVKENYTIETNARNVYGYYKTILDI